MILVDFSQIYIASFMAETKGDPAAVIEPGLIRHIALNMIRGINVKFKREYGEMVIAADSGSWRKNAWPYYKAHRPKAKDASGINWKKLYECLNQVGEEINQNFPYRYVTTPFAEGDDIIGVLVINRLGEKNDSILNFPCSNKNVIISGDGDFVQLQVFNNVKQWDPIRSRYLTSTDPRTYLIEHVMEGDREDGVPNFLSPDNSFTDHIRQKPLSKKKLAAWAKLVVETNCYPEEWSEIERENYDRNMQMISLWSIPNDTQERILNTFDAQGNKKGNVFDYLRLNRMSRLMQNANDF